MRSPVYSAQQRGRAQHLLLDDGAWDFVVENLSQPLPATQKASRVLERVLAKLGAFLESHGSAFSEFVGDSGSAPAATLTDARPKPPSPPKVRTEQELRNVCLTLSGGPIGKPIRLADLRANVTASRELIDQLLQSMQRAGRLVLFKMDNPSEITPADEQAALDIAGHPRHLVYLEA